MLVLTSVYRTPSGGSTPFAGGPAIDDAERAPGPHRSASHLLVTPEHRGCASQPPRHPAPPVDQSRPLRRSRVPLVDSESATWPENCASRCCSAAVRPSTTCPFCPQATY